MLKKTILFTLIFALLLPCPFFKSSSESTSNVIPIANTAAFDLECESAVLMEAKTGTVLYEKNADTPLPPASVTKIMTLLLVMEAIDSGALSFDTIVTASANAASMGGSQIYLKEGESMTVNDLVKSVVIASANDAAVALAEHIAGSESAFVAKMNEKAAELGMKNTNFENTNGLDDTAVNHVISARDIAIMSRALIAHEEILKYSSTWTDSIRNGEFGLTNTNRLVRFYNGCTGLKTGSTSKAKFCISATAERDGMSLIAVIMAAPSRDIRNNAAKQLLDYGFANYDLFSPSLSLPSDIKALGSANERCTIGAENFCCVIPKGSSKNVKAELTLPQSVKAPINIGEKIGSIKFTLDGNTLGECNIVANENLKKISYFQMLDKIVAFFLLKR